MTRPVALIVILHGNVARAASPYDTAMALVTALADAGFVVVALSQISDNYTHHSPQLHPGATSRRGS